MPNRRGFTLVEILVAMVIMLVVTGSMYTLLNTTQRLSRAQSERVDLQANVRTGSLVIPSELRELSTVAGGLLPQNDILSMTATTIRYRAMRGIGFVCSVPTLGEVRIKDATFSGLRKPVPVRDGAYVFSDGDPDKSGDDLWLPVPIAAVSMANKCADGVSDAITLTIAPVGLLPIPVGTPVRTFEVMELKLYVADGKSWLGAQAVSAGELTAQPMLGPLADVNGLGLAYFDKDGAVTADVKQVKSIQVTMRGVTDKAINARGGSGTMMYVGDTLVTGIALRNAVWP